MGILLQSMEREVEMGFNEWWQVTAEGTGFAGVSILGEYDFTI